MAVAFMIKLVLRFKVKTFATTKRFEDRFFTLKWAIHFHLCVLLPPSLQWLYLLTQHPAEKEACSIPCPLLWTQATAKHKRGWSGHDLNTQSLYTQDGPKAHKYTDTHSCEHWWRGLGGLRMAVGGKDGEGKTQRGVVKAMSPGPAWTQMSTAWLPVHGNPAERETKGDNQEEKRWRTDVTTKNKEGREKSLTIWWPYFKTRF